MHFLSKLALVLVAVAGGTILVLHAGRALHASVPKDMPQDAQFVQSGFDIARNESTGQWIACEENRAGGDDWCRVTDQQGTVVFQGGFLPVDSPGVVAQRDLRVAAKQPDKIWVRGPFEAGPIPVIPLENGQLLVPEVDQEALANRWARDPAEFQQVMSSRQ